MLIPTSWDGMTNVVTMWFFISRSWRDGSACGATGAEGAHL